MNQAATTAGLVSFGATRLAGVSANHKLNIAAIGVGGMGAGNIEKSSNENIVALCDVDFKRGAETFNRHPKARRFKDFRVMFDKMEKEIDAVIIATPDHTHAVATMEAMRRGKHVYTQKPLTHSIGEARQLTEAARRYGVETQMGNQGHSSSGARQTVEWIQAGVIGEVREVHCWSDRPLRGTRFEKKLYWPQGIAKRSMSHQTVPDTLDWDLWLGPAPFREYQPDYVPFNWRGWWDFGTGAIGDMSCHTANLAFMALNLGHPLSVEALDHGPINEETFPAWATTKTEFGARGAMPPLSYYWYEGKFPDGKKNLPPMDLFHGEKPTNSGSIIVGDKGILYSPNDYGSSWKLLPGDDFKDYEAPDAWIPRIGGGDQAMKNEWVEAMRGGKPALSNFDYASQMTESILLGNAALKAGGRIEWDSTRLQAKNMDISDIIQREYRPGWMA
ncbi:MAG TPA: dehydrogenase [Verrucomicrobiales bacterium]|nr:dehydrogenase [Verrucomicrobiales bacterium]